MPYLARRALCGRSPSPSFAPQTAARGTWDNCNGGMIAGTYDVVVMGFRLKLPETPASALSRIVGISHDTAERLSAQLPCTVFRHVTYAEAESYAASLRLAGAHVAIASHDEGAKSGIVPVVAAPHQVAEGTSKRPPCDEQARSTLVGTPEFDGGKFGGGAFSEPERGVVSVAFFESPSAVPHDDDPEPRPSERPVPVPGQHSPVEPWFEAASTELEQPSGVGAGAEPSMADQGARPAPAPPESAENVGANASFAGDFGRGLDEEIEHGPRSYEPSSRSGSEWNGELANHARALPREQAPNPKRERTSLLDLIAPAFPPRIDFHRLRRGPVANIELDAVTSPAVRAHSRATGRYGRSGPAQHKAGGTPTIIIAPQDPIGAFTPRMLFLLGLLWLSVGLLLYTNGLF